MEPITVLARYNVGAAVWENFEYLYICGLDWAKKHEKGNYPKHMRRASLPELGSIVADDSRAAA